jgi:hypothetical protein
MWIIFILNIKISIFVINLVNLLLILLTHSSYYLDIILYNFYKVIHTYTQIIKITHKNTKKNHAHKNPAIN